MDIYSAENYVNKLLQYVEDIKEKQPNMYQKSKDRLKDLAGTCTDVVRVISEILQDEALASDDIEFDSSGRSDVCNMIASMEQELNSLKQFINYPDDIKLVPARTTIKTSKISSQMRKQTLVKYGQVLQELSKVSTGYTSADDCAKVLWRWFDDRFFQTPKLHPEFRYNIRRLKMWVQDIVIAYGKAVSSNQVSEFISEFYNWCDELYLSDVGDKFAVPYSVYLINQSAEPADCTLSACVIWDILIDAGLKELCTSDPYDLYPSEDCVYEKVHDLNESVLENYQHYTYDSSVISMAQIVQEVK